MIPLLVDDSNSFVSNWAAELFVWAFIIRLGWLTLAWFFGGVFPLRRSGYGKFR